MSRRSLAVVLLGLAAILASAVASVRAADPLRAPAYPLIACDPYFSVWSNVDRLADAFPVHWTGKTNALTSFVKVDGKNYRLMGRVSDFDDLAQPMTQTNVAVRATNTTYTFADAGVEVTLKFTNPNLPDDIDVLSRPATYLTWNVKSTDGKAHDVAVYFDASAELCVNLPDQEVVGSREGTDALDVMKIGTKEQPILGKVGDDLRIDWGYFFVAVEKGLAQTAICSDRDGRGSFLKEGVLPKKDDERFPRQAQDAWPVLSVAFNCGAVSNAPVSKRLIVAYDDEYCLEYLGERLQAYWRKDGMNALEMLDLANVQYADLMNRCAKFDADQWELATLAGGEKYASFCAIVYPQVIAAQKVSVLPNGKTIMPSKENFSNGCVATVDLLYPASPIFMVYSNELLKATIVPTLEYAQSGRWKFPFAPHDMGTYPKMNGQVYGGGEKTEENQMPVEESANILIVCDVIARKDGNVEFLKEYWSMLNDWAEYLLEKGLDPEDQLCTDDFAGRLAHNANLSIKAIIALACFADLCERAGELDKSKSYRAKAEEFAVEWQKMAATGDHYGLTFDRPDSWSQKYNLVWDKLLGLNLFPPEVAKKEVAFYKTVLNEYGLPLDSRKEFTKADWQVWTATLADNRDDFDALMAPLYKYVDQTGTRVPVADWYHTDTGLICAMQARSVMGAVFIKMFEYQLNHK